jgi:hypothetical protein
LMTSNNWPPGYCAGSMIDAAGLLCCIDNIADLAHGRHEGILRASSHLT